jgi:hypothetical protein
VKANKAAKRQETVSAITDLRKRIILPFCKIGLVEESINILPERSIYSNPTLVLLTTLWFR